MAKSKRKKVKTSEFWDAEDVVTIVGIAIIGLLSFVPYAICAWIASQFQKSSTLTKLHIPEILKFIGITASCLWFVALVSFCWYMLGQ